MEVGQKDDLDSTGVDAELVEVLQDRRARVEEDPAVDGDAGVVALDGECRPGAEEGDPQAIVTPRLR
jgi:hypothetical protein